MLESLKLSLYQQAIDYANIRSQWKLMSLEQRKEVDPRRTIAGQGKDNSWRTVIGNDRQIIGDLASWTRLNV